MTSIRLAQGLALGLSLAALASAGLADGQQGEVKPGASAEAAQGTSAPSPIKAVSGAAAAATAAAAKGAESGQANEPGAGSAAAAPAAGSQPAAAASPTTPSSATSSTATPPPAGAAHAQAAAPAAEAVEPASGVPIKDLVPAKQLFGAVRSPASLAARSIGSYARGCLAGAAALPVDGPNWQAMRLSRNRNWGHPELIKLIQRLADEAWRYEGWQGLLVGDISQPRGGPMATGHASHQIGLDADIWFTPMPEKRFTNKQRETVEATSMLAADEISVNPKVYTETHTKLVKRVASYDNVERVLVHPAIKKAMCEQAGSDRGWLAKVRPYWGHYYHFHVRIACPPGVAGCVPQAPPPGDDGCGKELADWIKRVTPRPPEPVPPGQVAKKEKPKPPVTLDQLPQECRVVLNTGEPGVPKELMAAQARADALIAAARTLHAKAEAAHAQAAHSKAQAAKHAAKSGAAEVPSPADSAAAN